MDEYKEESWLREKIIQDGESYSSTAKNAPVCAATIKYWANKYGIESTYNEGHPPKHCNDEDKLIRLYCEEEFTGYEVAEQFGVSAKTVYKWLEGLGIDRRDRYRFEEGEENPTWTGWSQSEEDLVFYSSMEWKEARQRERSRAGNRCEECGSSSHLVVHHIISIQNGGEKLDSDNLEVLCRSCHRERHEEMDDLLETEFRD